MAKIAQTAIERLQAALKQQAIFGVKTNAQLLLAIATHPAFQAGMTYTNFLEEYGLLDGEPTNRNTTTRQIQIRKTCFER